MGFPRVEDGHPFLKHWCFSSLGKGPCPGSALCRWIAMHTSSLRKTHWPRWFCSARKRRTPLPETCHSQPWCVWTRRTKRRGDATGPCSNLCSTAVPLIQGICKVHSTHPFPLPEISPASVNLQTKLGKRAHYQAKDNHRAAFLQALWDLTVGG